MGQGRSSSLNRDPGGSPPRRRHEKAAPRFAPPFHRRSRRLPRPRRRDLVQLGERAKPGRREHRQVPIRFELDEEFNRHVETRMDLNDFHPVAARGHGPRSCERSGTPGSRAGSGQHQMGPRRPGLLRWRGRAVHQRQDRGPRGLLRPKRRQHRRTTPR